MAKRDPGIPIVSTLRCRRPGAHRAGSLPPWEGGLAGNGGLRQPAPRMWGARCRPCLLDTAPWSASGTSPFGTCIPLRQDRRVVSDSSSRGAEGQPRCFLEKSPKRLPPTSAPEPGAVSRTRKPPSDICRRRPGPESSPEQRAAGPGFASRPEQGGNGRVGRGLSHRPPQCTMRRGQQSVRAVGRFNSARQPVFGTAGLPGCAQSSPPLPTPPRGAG